MKKIFTLLLTLICLVCYTAFFVACDDEGVPPTPTPTPEPSQPYDYLLEDGEYTIKGIGQVVGNDIVIPDEYNGKPVTKIGANAFAYKTIKSVVIGENVTTIGEKAFYWSELESVTFGSKVTTLEKECFHNSKLKELTLPATLTQVGDKAFSRCYYLAKVIIPQTITSLGKEMFANCGGSSTNKELIIEGGNGLTKIGENAFQSSAIKTLSLSNTVEIIEAGAFSYSKISEFTIPEKVTTLSTETFANCSMLTQITFNKNLESIGGKAFYYCGKLADIIWAEDGKLETISSSAFYNCGSLAVVEIPDSVKRLGECSFAKCSNLERVVVGKNVTFIGAGSFAYDYEDYITGKETAGNPRMLDYLEFKSPENWIQSTNAGSTSSTFWYKYVDPELAAQNYHNRRFFHWLKGEQLPKNS